MNRARLLINRVNGDRSVWFYCPGCKTHHQVIDGRWTWNQREDLPTFDPSVLVRFTQISPEGLAMIERGDPPPVGTDRYPSREMVCHSFVRAGQIRYLGDSTHAFAGRTIDLPPIADSMGAEH